MQDREAKVPRWVHVRPPQPSYNGEDVRVKGRTVNLVTKKNHVQLGLKWYVVGNDGRPAKEMGAFMIRRAQRQHKALMNSLNVPTASETGAKST
ncbi:hypothetical protein TB2_040551 [Malus domestica]